MQTFLQQLLGLLIAPPGNLVVHLVLVFSIMAALQAVLVGRRYSQYPGAGRIVLGLSAILAGQLVLFLSSSLAWQGIANPHQFIPPLDRAVAAWGLAWIVWLWSFPRASRAPDAINGLLNLIIVILLLFTLVAWNGQDPNLSFNATWLDWGWSLFPIFIAVIGILFILLERPEGWGIGLGMLGLHLAGFLFQLLSGDPNSDFAPSVRFAQLASYPLLASLAQRLHVAPAPKTRTEERSYEEDRQYTAEPRTLFAWMQVAVQKDQDSGAAALTRAVAQTMLADLCFLVPMPSGDSITLEHGYDSVRDETLDPITLSLSQAPNLASAVQRGRPFRLLGDDPAVPDLKTLAETLGLDIPGNLLSVPLSTAEISWGALLLLSPYSRRVWSGMDQTYLITAVESMVQLLTRPESVPKAIVSAQIERLQSEAAGLQEQLEEAARQNELLQTQLSLAAEQAGDDPEIESLLALQQESQELIQNLQNENQQLRESLGEEAPVGKAKNEEVLQLENELRITLGEVARLQNALAGAQMKILSLEMQSKNAAPPPLDGQEVITATLQELRQPVTSIFGYTDLLMSETVGLLGAIQRKLLDRIRASSERIRALVDDLIRIIVLEGGALDLGAEEVDMMAVIDTAVQLCRSQLQEKCITLRLNMPPQLPALQADRDAMEQVAIHLLQNAITVTPELGAVLLFAGVETQEDRPYLLLRVTDSGGGIAAEDLPRVFWRHFRPDNPAIPGTGDKGVGLSVARVLVEAHGGRIWVDSQPGEETTFSVLLPVTSTQSSQLTPNTHESLA